MAEIALAYSQRAVATRDRTTLRRNSDSADQLRKNGFHSRAKEATGGASPLIKNAAEGDPARPRPTISRVRAGGRCTKRSPTSSLG